MGFNPMQLMQLKPKMNEFAGRHPRFVQFFGTVSSSGVREGSVIEISITDPEGNTLCTNMKVSSEDLELMNEVSGILQNMK